MANLKVDTVSGIGTEGTVFDGGLHFRSKNYLTLPKGTTTQRGRGRGFYMLGYHGTPSAGDGKRIDYINIQSQGNSIKFGDLTANRYTLGAGANSTSCLLYTSPSPRDQA